MSQPASPESPSVRPSVEMIEGVSRDNPVAPILQSILANAVIHNATDIHFRPRSAGPVKYRKAGRLFSATEWRHAEKGMLTDREGRFVDHGNFEDYTAALLKDGKGARTVVYRLNNDFQVRVENVPSNYGPKLFIRVQPRNAPSLRSTFAHSPGAIEVLEEAKGLVLVVGELGRGKTTTAASIAAHLMAQGRHVFAAEDPVEYIADKQTDGEFTYTNCRFISSEGPLLKEDARPTLKQALASALRADFDALQLGEIRERDALTAALSVANAGKPVITTFHAKSIGNALTRLLTEMSQVMGEQAAKLTLAQSIDAVVYVSLAYTTEGAPVPLLLTLPFLGQEQRRIIAKSNPETLLAEVEGLFSSQKSSIKGLITRDAAVEAAAKAGATAPSARAALPPVIKFDR